MYSFIMYYSNLIRQNYSFAVPVVPFQRCILKLMLYYYANLKLILFPIRPLTLMYAACEVIFLRPYV